MLTSELLDQIRSRAQEIDRANEFAHEDFELLQEAGYLRAHVPTEFGGGGLTLAELAHQQAKLAGAHPGLALAVNMHHVWVAVAVIVHSRGESYLDWLLQSAAAGEVFAFGVSEAGNDLVLFGSDTDAQPQPDGSYRFTGTKIFTSLSPKWTKLGTFGADTSDPDSPKNVYAFIDRTDAGITVKSDWDALGMRASQSCTTVLDAAHAPAHQVVRHLDPGPSNDSLIFGIFASFELLLASVYTGIGERALAVAIETVHKRRSKKTGAPYAHDPDIRWRIGAAGIAMDALWPQIESLCADVASGADHGPLWYAKLSAVKVRATETAKETVERAVRVSGGSSYFNRHELSRLYRDVLAGLFHPSDDESAHGTMATALLGPLP